MHKSGLFQQLSSLDILSGQDRGKPSEASHCGDIEHRNEGEICEIKLQGRDAFENTEQTILGLNL